MMGAMETDRARPTRAPATPRPPSSSSVLVRYTVATAIATSVIVAGGYFVLRSVAIDEAKRDTRTRVENAGLLVEAALTDSLLTGDRQALGAVESDDPSD